MVGQSDRSIEYAACGTTDGKNQWPGEFPARLGKLSMLWISSVKDPISWLPAMLLFVKPESLALLAILGAAQYPLMSFPS